MNLASLNNKHFLVLMGNASTIFIGFATSFLLFHFLSIEAVGMWFFIISLVTLCESARAGFLSTGTVTFYAGTDDDRAATVLGSVWFLALVFSGILLIINAAAFLLLPPMQNTEYSLCLKWVGITYFSSVPIDITCWRLQAEEKYARMFWFRMVNSISTILGFVVLIVMHTITLENALLVNFLTNCFTSILGLVTGMTGLRFIFRKTRQCSNELLQYGKYMLGTTSFSVLLVNVDTWILNFVLGPAVVAVYNLAIRFMAIVDLPLRFFITTGMSEMAISYNRHDLAQVGHIFKKYTGMLTLAFIPLIIIAIGFADIPITLLGGPQYSHSIAANSFRLFMILSILYPFDRLNGLTLDVIRKTKTNFYKVIIMLAVKVVGNFAGLLFFGNIYGINLSSLLMVVAAIIYGNARLKECIQYKISDILVLGYQEMKNLIQRNLGLSGVEVK